MNRSRETLCHPFATQGLHDVLEACGGIPVHESLGAAIDRLDAAADGIRELMQETSVTSQATLVFFAVESALALVIAAHAGIEPAGDAA